MVRLLRKSPRTRSTSSQGIWDLSVPSWWPEALTLYAEHKWDILGTPRLPKEGLAQVLSPMSLRCMVRRGSLCRILFALSAACGPPAQTPLSEYLSLLSFACSWQARRPSWPWKCLLPPAQVRSPYSCREWGRLSKCGAGASCRGHRIFKQGLFLSGNLKTFCGQCSRCGHIYLCSPQKSGQQILIQSDLLTPESWLPVKAVALLQTVIF